MSRKNKFTKSFKLKAVQEVLKNNLSITQVCDNLEISKTDLKKWVKYYKQYGISGLESRIKNTIYTSDFKLSVIRSIVETGLSTREAALINNIPSPTTVWSWYLIYQVKGAKGLYEARIKLATNIWRVFCFFDKGKLVILLNGFAKKTQKTPKKEIHLAIKLMEQYYEEK